MSDADLLDTYNQAWNALPYSTPLRELERVALRAVYEAARADQ